MPVPCDITQEEISTSEQDNTMHPGSSVTDVARWVRSLRQLGEYAKDCAKKFEDNTIDGYVLFRMNSEPLKEIQITAGNRFNMLFWKRETSCFTQAALTFTSPQAAVGDSKC